MSDNIKAFVENMATSSANNFAESVKGGHYPGFDQVNGLGSLKDWYTEFVEDNDEPWWHDWEAVVDEVDDEDGCKKIFIECFEKVLFEKLLEK